MRVLLVGSTGFIGRQIHFELSQQGWDVIELNRTDSNRLGYANKEALADVFSKFSFDCIISSAWTTSHSTYRNSDENFVHQRATENLALEAKRYRVPIFVALGSAAEYGNHNLAASSLMSDLKSVDKYSSAKISTFQSLTKIFDATSTLFIWPRIFQPYGHRQDSKRFLPYLISSVSSQNEPEIRNPNDVCDWISVVDVAKAIVYSVMNKIGGALDVGTGVGTSNLEIANIILSILGRQDIPPLPSLIPVKHGLVMSPNTPLTNHGWCPEINLRSGIKDLVSEEIC